MSDRLKELGFDQSFEVSEKEGKVPARVTGKYQDVFILDDGKDAFAAYPSESLEFMAATPLDRPVAGDWVKVEKKTGRSLIHEIFPRHSVIERRMITDEGQQVIGSNIDHAFVLQKVTEDFNLEVLEHYVAMINAGRVNPVILLSHSDEVDSAVLKKKLHETQDYLKIPDVFGYSNKTEQGFTRVKNLIQPGKTYAITGTRGSGKSALLDKIDSGSLIPKAGIEFPEADRILQGELRRLINGGLLVYDERMDEIFDWPVFDQNLEKMIGRIRELSSQCETRHCSHTNEKGCAVRYAVTRGELKEEDLEQFKRLAGK